MNTQHEIDRAKAIAAYNAGVLSQRIVINHPKRDIGYKLGRRGQIVFYYGSERISRRDAEKIMAAGNGRYVGFQGRV